MLQVLDDGLDGQVEDLVLRALIARHSGYIGRWQPDGSAHVAVDELGAALLRVGPRRSPRDDDHDALVRPRNVVNGTLAWLIAHRRLARDYERDPAVSESMIRWAAINTISRASPAAARLPASNDAHFQPSVIFSNTLWSLTGGGLINRWAPAAVLTMYGANPSLVRDDSGEDPVHPGAERVHHGCSVQIIEMQTSRFDGVPGAGQRGPRST